MTGKTAFFPFSFFPVFVQKCFEQLWALCGKKRDEQKALGVEDNCELAVYQN
jgi:hypothetical protein